MPSHARAEAPTPYVFDHLHPTCWSKQVDWSAYATAYDLLAEHNPAYQSLLDDFETFLGTIEKPQLIYDIGGGTGNYTKIVARECPGSEIRFVEPDIGMLGLAKSKLSASGNVNYFNRAFEDIDTPGTADLVICVHALYAMPQPEARLVQLRKLLRPGGWLYLVDLGRHMDVHDWRAYLFAHLKMKLGLIGALRVFWQGREIARQNQTILRAQQSGDFWTHTEAEFASAARAAGLEIHRQQIVYRHYSDLLVCRAMRHA